MIKQEKYNILSSTLILSMGILLSRIVGFIYRIPIQRILGDEGHGLYGQAYQIYTVILTVTAIAMPGALSKIISQSETLNEHQQSDQIFRIVVKYFTILAFILGGLLFLFSDVISEIAFPGDYIGGAIRIFAPTVIIATIIASLRGYFQGLGNMKPTAISQVLEQIVNAFVSVFLAYYFTKISITLGVVGSCIGTAAGAIVALMTLLIYLKRVQKERHSILTEKTIALNEMQLFKQLLSILIPTIISTAVFSIVTFIDYSMISRLLPQSIALIQQSGRLDLIPVAHIENLDISIIVQKLKGQYSFQYNTFINIPVSLILQLGLAAIPSISSDMAKGDKEGINQKIYEIMKLGLLFATPASIAFLIFGVEIIQLVVGVGTCGGELLCVGGISLIVITIAQLTSGILQGMAKAKIASIHAVIACVVKVIFNFILISIPELHIYGLIISTFVCYLVYAILNISYLYRVFKVKMNWMDLLVKPLFCSLIMGITSFFIFNIIQNLLDSTRITMLIIIPICIAIYYKLAQKTHIMIPEVEQFVSNLFRKRI